MEAGLQDQSERFTFWVDPGHGSSGSPVAVGTVSHEVTEGVGVAGRLQSPAHAARGGNGDRMRVMSSAMVAAHTQPDC